MFADHRADLRAKRLGTIRHLRRRILDRAFGVLQSPQPVAIAIAAARLRAMLAEVPPRRLADRLLACLVDDHARGDLNAAKRSIRTMHPTSGSRQVQDFTAPIIRTDRRVARSSPHVAYKPSSRPRIGALPFEADAFLPQCFCRRQRDLPMC